MENNNSFFNNTKTGNSAGKRTAVCLDCGHSWQPRNSTAAKPAICSHCKSRNCAWQDEVEQAKPVMSAALSAIVNGQQPTPQESKEERDKMQMQTEAPPDKAELKRMAENAARLAVKEYAALAEDESESEPEPEPKYAGRKAAKAAVLTEEQQDILDADEERKAVSAALKEYFGEDVQVIDNPNEDLSEETPDGEPQYVAWFDKDGKPVCSALVSPETLEEVQEIIEKDRQKAIQETSKEHLAELDEQGLLDIDNVLAVKEEEEAAMFEDEEEDTRKAKKAHGISKGGLVVVALIMGAAVAIPVIISIYENNRKKEQIEQNLEEQQINTTGNSSAALMRNLLNNSHVLTPNQYRAELGGSLSLRGGN